MLNHDETMNDEHEAEDSASYDQDYPDRPICSGCDGLGVGYTGCRCGVCRGSGLEPKDSLFDFAANLSRAAAGQLVVSDEQESVVERFDRLASEFYRETGVMAPGKDVAALGYERHTPEERIALWDQWNEQRNKPK